MEEQSFQYL